MDPSMDTFLSRTAHCVPICVVSLCSLSCNFRHLKKMNSCLSPCSLVHKPKRAIDQNWGCQFLVKGTVWILHHQKQQQMASSSIGISTWYYMWFTVGTEYDGDFTKCSGWGRTDEKNSIVTYSGVWKTMPKTLFSSSLVTDMISAPVFWCWYKVAVDLYSLMKCCSSCSNPNSFTSSGLAPEFHQVAKL